MMASQVFFAFQAIPVNGYRQLVLARMIDEVDLRLSGNFIVLAKTFLLLCFNDGVPIALFRKKNVTARAETERPGDDPGLSCLVISAVDSSN
jgi:hypothetical protein